VDGFPVEKPHVKFHELLPQLFRRGNVEKAGGLSTMSDQFIILSRDGGRQTARSKAIIPDVDVVLDPGAETLSGRWQRINGGLVVKGGGAWAAAMDGLDAGNLPDRTWLIEDDVQLRLGEFLNVVDWTRANAPDSYCVPKVFRRDVDVSWFWWPYSNCDIGCFNQMCCLPRKLLENILARESSHYFHEIWFPSVAVETGVPVISWRETELDRLFGPWQWRPVVEPGPGLRHPVKI
jgi:hypothetical protein